MIKQQWAFSLAPKFFEIIIKDFIQLSFTIYKSSKIKIQICKNVFQKEIIFLISLITWLTCKLFKSGL